MHYCGVSTARPVPSLWRRWPAPRRRGALSLLALVLLLHALLLGGLAPGAGPLWRAEPPRPLLVRQIVRQPAPAFAPTLAPAADAAKAEPTPAHRSRARNSSAAAATPPVATPIPALAFDSTGDEALGPAERVTDQALVPNERVADAGGLAVPVYATRRPPPLDLLFELRRGAAVGLAELAWRPEDAHYRLTLQTRLAAAPLMGSTSVGGFDPAGLAPLRYTESRRGRELRAANFQRDNGRVTFSGPAIEHPLVPGGQDRLSWMVQLAAVMAANPALSEADAQVSIWVVGSRGDAEVWTFTVQGRTALELPIGRVEDALHMKREPRRPYDTQVQVWLDPSRHFLPAQAWLRVRATGEGSELRLQDLK